MLPAPGTRAGSLHRRPLPSSAGASAAAQLAKLQSLQQEAAEALAHNKLAPPHEPQTAAARALSFEVLPRENGCAMVTFLELTMLKLRFPSQFLRS